MAGGPTYVPGTAPDDRGAPNVPAALPGNPGGRPSKQTPAIDTTASIMNTAATKHGIPPWVLWGIFGAESSFGKTSNWFGLTSVGRSTDGPNGSPTFHGDADIAAATIARLLKANGNNLDTALYHYSGGNYSKVGADHGYKSSAAYIAGLARQAPLKIKVPTNPIQDFAASGAGDAVAGALKAIATPAEILGYLVTHLADPHFWLRVLYVIGGFTALVMGLHQLVGGPTPATVAAHTAGPARLAGTHLKHSAQKTAQRPYAQAARRRMTLNRKAAS